MVIYLLYSIILFLSVIIATFNDIFATVRQQSELVYNYLRYAVIIEYESRPLLPPPFIIISWIYMCFYYLHRLRKKRRLLSAVGLGSVNKMVDSSMSNDADQNRNDELSPQRPSSGLNKRFDWFDESSSIAFMKTTETSMGLKLFLTAEEVEKLHDFEEECVDDYWRQARKREKLDAELHEDVLNQKLDYLQFRIGEIHIHQNRLRGLVHMIDEHLRVIQDTCLHPSNRTDTSESRNQREALLIECLLELLENQSTVGHEKFEGSSHTTVTPTPKTGTSSLRDKLSAYLKQLKGEAESDLHPSVTQQVPLGRSHANSDRSPSPISRGLKHRSSRTSEYRLLHPTSTFGSSGFPTVSDRSTDYPRQRSMFGRPRLSSYRVQDCAYREYTTICDDIDISCLSSSSSSATTPTGSQTNLTTIGSQSLYNRNQIDMLSPGKIPKIPVIHISEAKAPTFHSLNEADEPIQDNETEAVAVVDAEQGLHSAPFYISSTSLNTNRTNSADLEPVQCPEGTFNTSPNRITPSRSLERSFSVMEDLVGIPALSTTAEHDRGAHSEPSPLRDMSTSSNIDLNVIRSRSHFPGNLTDRRSRPPRRNTSSRDQEVKSSTRRSDFDRRFSNIASEAVPSHGSKEVDSEFANDTSEEEIGLQQAEKAERTELRGVLIRRLRKLSVASGIHSPVTSISTQSRFPVLQSGSAAETSVASVTRLAGSISSPHSVVPPHPNAQEATVLTDSGLPQPQVFLGDQQSPVTDDREHLTEEQLIAGFDPISRDSVGFGPSDMGDFLSHNAREEEAIDPDLDLDVYSSITRASSLRWSTDSPVPDQLLSSAPWVLSDHQPVVDRQQSSPNES